MKSKKDVVSYTIILVVLIIVNSCSTNNLTEIDLNNKGIPVTIIVPQGCEITEGIANEEEDEMSFLNYVIKKDNFILDVFMPEQDLQGDLSDYVRRATQLAKEEVGFVEFVKTDEAGFIYKLKTEEGFGYNFSYTIIKNNRAIEFLAGLNFSDYTLTQIEKLYEAAKTAK